MERFIKPKNNYIRLVLLFFNHILFRVKAGKEIIRRIKQK